PGSPPRGRRPPTYAARPHRCRTRPGCCGLPPWSADLRVRGGDRLCAVRPPLRPGRPLAVVAGDLHEHRRVRLVRIAVQRPALPRLLLDHQPAVHRRVAEAVLDLPTVLPDLLEVDQYRHRRVPASTVCPGPLRCAPA